VPKVIVFAGHLIDRPTRPHPRFPAALEPIVHDAIRERLARIGPAIGYAAAACGADLLFLEAMRANGCDTHIVLPYGTDQFQPDSVDYLPGTTWSARFDAALQAATHVVTAAEHRLGDGGMSYEYGFRVLDGEAAMHADKLDTELVCLAVWDGLPGDGPGGTASSIEHWRRAQRRIEIIDLTALRTQHAAGRRAEAQPAAASHTLAASSETQSSQAGTADEPPDTMNAEIVGLLFADAHGFSKLTEAELPVFVEHYLGLVAAVLARMPAPPLLTNTWGDGLYVVYRDVQDTGEFALRLNEAVLRTDWPSLGIRHGLSLRIGLHAGPAYACTDPVTRRPNYIGAHVSRAARIEPIAPAGEVYASGAFAALARSEQARGFRCTYVGETPLAKGYGTFPTYVVRRSGLRQP
jgi:class 3 adenylate cyclase